MSDLIAFLNARLDDDEAPARRSFDEAGDYDIRGTDATLDHFANWKPERVLAEVAARRRVVAAAIERIESGRAEDGQLMTSGANLATDVLRLLALSYADHEDFDEGWLDNGDPQL